MNASFLQCFVTYPSRKAAEKTVTTLLEKNLAACGQILGPITSRYRWKGQIVSAKEWLVLAKTTKRRWPAFVREVRKRHPYEVPEIVAVPITAGEPAYLAWITENTRSKI